MNESSTHEGRVMVSYTCDFCRRSIAGYGTTLSVEPRQWRERCDDKAQQAGWMLNRPLKLDMCPQCVEHTKRTRAT